MPSSDSDVELYRRHSAELTRYATVLVGPADAADVVSDAVVGAFAAPAWPGVENRRAYLYRAVLHRALDERRARSRRQRRELAAADRADQHPEDSSVDARRALARLSPQQRAVVYLTYWEDRTPADIAALLGVGEGSVRKQLARAREHLRRFLDG